jgi:hypothetical protein
MFAIIAIFFAINEKQGGNLSGGKTNTQYF